MMSSYAITFYSRDDITFGRDDSGNFTVTVNEDATPDTIKIVDNDRDGEDRFSGSTRAGPTDQHAYGSVDDTEFAGDPIQPLAALPGLENADQQVMAIGIGNPVHTVGYSFNYAPVPGETVSFNYHGYIKDPSYDSDDLYVKGQTEDQDTDPEDDDDDHDYDEDDHDDDEDDHDDDEDDHDDGDDDHDDDDDAHDDDEDDHDDDGDDDHDDDDDDDEDDDEDDDHPPCFTRGTTLRTKNGSAPVEDLVIGDLLWTEAHGYRPLRWICRREVPAKGDFAPIRISAGTLGADRDILVSPAHRMLVQGPEVEVLFGVPKALVAAKDLVNDRTITRETALETVEYFHIMFDQHEVLEAHGTLSESFFPEPATVGRVGAAQRAVCAVSGTGIRHAWLFGRLSGPDGL